MNYTKEINAFYDKLETTHVSSSAVALWHTLMHINYKTGWKKEFSVSIFILCSKSKLAERTVYKARKELADKGFLRFESRSGRQSAIYQMISLQKENDDFFYDHDHADKESLNEKEAIFSATHAEKEFHRPSQFTELPVLHADNDASLISINNNKEDDVFTSSYFTKFKKYFYLEPTQTQMDMIQRFIVQNKMTEELICYAFELAAERGKPFMYAKSILTNWAQKGITTVKKAVESAKEYYERITDKQTFVRQQEGKTIERKDQGGAAEFEGFRFYKI